MRSRLVKILEHLLIPVTATVTVLTIVHYDIVLPFLGRILLLGVLILIIHASWAGYGYNRGRNDEWPYNVATLVVSTLGAIGLIASVLM